MRRKLILCLLATSWMIAAPAASQEGPVPCGETYRVVRGDTLSGIAIRCATTVSRILELNPEIENADVISVGQLIRLQESPPIVEPEPLDTEPVAEEPVEPAPAEPEGAAPRIWISPASGPAGTDVTLEAENLPPNQEVRLAGGPRRGAYTDIAVAITTSEGTLERDLRVSDNAPDDDEWVFWVITSDPQEEFRSEPFFVTPRPGEGPGQPLLGVDRRPVTITVAGMISDEGLSCVTMRSDTGVLYALTGAVPSDLQSGERVVLRGRPAERSACSRGIVVDVRYLDRLDARDEGEEE